VYHQNQCKGNVIVSDPEVAESRWFTPLKGDPDYQKSFQDYGLLVAHAHVTYTDPEMHSATVEIIAKHKDNTIGLTYVFDGKKQATSSASFSTEQLGPLSIQVQGSDGSIVQLEPVDFAWNAPPVRSRGGDYRNGQKGAIVEMFGWPHSQIEQECKSLATMGYLGVKIFPAQEQVLSSQPFNSFINPWYFMYQPVSYRLQGRMGTRDELRQMIYTCRRYGIRVYADAVVNHMTGSGNDANTHHRTLVLDAPHGVTKLLLYKVVILHTIHKGSIQETRLHRNSLLSPMLLWTFIVSVLSTLGRILLT